MSTDSNSNHNDEAVSHFLALTGSSDASQAQHYLEMSAYNIETAVNLFFEYQAGGLGSGDTGGLGSTAGSSVGAGAGSGSGSTHTHTSNNDDGVRAPDQTRTMRLMDFDEGPSSSTGGIGGIMGVGGGNDMAGLIHHPILGPHAAALMHHQNSASNTGGNTNDAAAMAQLMAFADDIHDDHNVMDMDTRSASAHTSGSAAASSGARTSVRDMINASTNFDSNTSTGLGLVGNHNHTSASIPATSSNDNMNNNNDNNDEVQVTATPSSNNNNTRHNTLQNLFAPPTNIMHTAGGFQGARNVAKNARRWLLVNLQNDSDFACHALNRDVWRDDLVEGLVREGFIFWQNINTTQDGQLYAQRYNVTSYPHIGIIDPRTARLVYRKEGWTQQDNPLTAEGFAELAVDFCSRHSFDKPPSIPKSSSNGRGNSGVAAAVPSTTTVVDQMTEEEQLQAAIRASMNEASGMKSTNDDDDEVMEYDNYEEEEYEYIDSDDDGDDNNNNNMKTENDNDTNMNDEEDMEEEVVVVEEVKELSFHDEIIAIDVGDEPDGTDGVARIMIRMPDGKRLVRKFKLEDTVKIVYAFVAKSNDDAKGGKEFEIKAGFPPKNLLPMIDDTIQNCGLAGDSVTVRWKED